MAKSAARDLANARVLDDAIEEVTRALASDGAVARSELVRLGVPRSHAAEALARLEARGFEATRRHVRVPLAEQLERRLASAGALPMRSIASHVAGGTRKEALAAARALLAGGKARSVVRSTEVVLVAASTPVLEGTRLDRLRGALVALGRAVKLAEKTGSALLPGDVAEAVRGFFPETPRGQGRAPTRGGTPTMDVVALVERLAGENGLVWVPTLVAHVGGRGAAPELHRELLEAARAGRIELRPESGMGRLSEDERRDCLPGPEGTVLSWARSLGAS